jgi:hypothetical protein
MESSPRVRVLTMTVRARVDHFCARGLVGRGGAWANLRVAGGMGCASGKNICRAASMPAHGALAGASGGHRSLDGQKLAYTLRHFARRVCECLCSLPSCCCCCCWLAVSPRQYNSCVISAARPSRWPRASPCLRPSLPAFVELACASVRDLRSLIRQLSPWDHVTTLTAGGVAKSTRTLKSREIRSIL